MCTYTHTCSHDTRTQISTMCSARNCLLMLHLNLVGYQAEWPNVANIGYHSHSLSPSMFGTLHLRMPPLWCNCTIVACWWGCQLATERQTVSGGHCQTSGRVRDWSNKALLVTRGRVVLSCAILCSLSDQAVFKKLFMNCCPKFISPLPPDYDALPENYIKVWTSLSLSAHVLFIYCSPPRSQPSTSALSSWGNCSHSSWCQ